MQKVEYPIREWTDPTIDKTTWADGPWRTEPDKIQWVDALSQLDCLMVRNHMGSWCGYVGVDPSHPDHHKPYQEIEHLNVHGGLTYSDRCNEGEGFAVCHIPYEGRPHDVWWFGFDCAHFMDHLPGHVARMRQLQREHPHLAALPYPEDMDDTRRYRDRAYVEKECRVLAAQLAARGRR